MNKELLISIKPEHLVNILNGKKTLELRKTVPKDYKGWVNIYCTKSKKIFRVGSLGFHDDELYKLPSGEIKFGCSVELMASDDYYDHNNFLNGKVVARFWFDEYDTYDFDNHGVNLYTDVEEYSVMYDDLERLYLDYREIEAYGKGKTLYAWHIENLEIFDKPKELSEFYKANLYTPYEVIRAYEETTRDLISYRLQRPPQSYQLVYVKGDKK